jgi:hypothetical protein
MKGVVKVFGSFAVMAALCLWARSASAQAALEDWTAVPTYESSPELFGLELRVGIFYPEGLGDDFTSPDYFGADVGPMLSAELHYFPFRLPYLGLVGAGAGLGWSQWDTENPGGEQGDRNTFEMITMRPFLLWRIDSLARELNVPIILTPKVGMDVVYWQTSPGIGATDADGWSVGPRLAGKVSLELDFLEPRAARQLDEEWGINHSEVFFELYGSWAGELGGSMLPVSGWGWAAGLGFTF